MLWQGNYHVAPDTAACDAWSGSIIDTEDPSRVVVTVDGAADLYNVAEGTYYWDVTASDCDWSVDLVAVAPLPDPTPTARPMAEVPRLVGSGQWDPNQGAKNPDWLTVEAARAALDAAGLVTGSCEAVFRFPYAVRRVIEQDPPPGTIVEIGSSVNVVVSESGCDVLTAPA